MPNCVKIFFQIKFPIQRLNSDRSVCMSVICYSGPISAVPTNEKLLGEGGKISVRLRRFLLGVMNFVGYLITLFKE